jgi:UDP-GlcNAc:undecaprenyl-phosphate GlcNAc-1-phosphate transferase
MVGVAVAFSFAIIWSGAAIWLGPRMGLVDSPTDSGLKVHTRPTPLLGGVGVFGGIHLGMTVEGAFSPALFVGTLLVLVLGLADDKLDLPPKLRLGAELGAATVLVALMDSGLAPPFGFAFGVVLTVVAINAVNLLDGLDGLVGSTAFVAAVGIAWAGHEGLGDSALGPVLGAALLGFLAFNWQPARIFLGDNGAYTIGMVLAYGALATTQGGVGSMLLVSIGLLGVFLTDLTVTILRRAMAGTALFAGDRSHIYDQLRDAGWAIRQIATAAASLQAVFATAFIGFAVTDPSVGMASLAIAVTGSVGLALFWRLGFLRQ